MSSYDEAAENGPIDRKCPCQSSFRNTEEVLAAVRSEVATESLIAWLKGEGVEEEGKDFSILKNGNDKLCNADSYGRCPNRVGAAFAILNAIRDGCRKYLDRPSASLSSALPLTLSTASFSPSVSESTSPVKPRYEDAFPSLQASTSASASATPNVLVPRKKKKQPARKQNDPHHNNFPVPKAQPQQNASNTRSDPAGPAVGSKPGQKRRIRPVLATAPPSSSWPIAPSAPIGVAANRNISNLPPDNPSEMMKRQHPDGLKQGNGWASANMGVAAKGKIVNLSSEDASAMLKQQSPIVFKNGSGWPSVMSSGSTGGNIANLPSEDPSAMSKLKPPPGFSGHKHYQKEEADNFKTKDGTQQSTLPVKNPHKAAQEEKQENESIFPIQDDSFRDRVVKLYTSLILHQLVPSIPLELHLLVRLLSVDLELSSTSMKEQKGTDDRPALEFIFSSSRACRDFAAQALTTLEPVLLALGFEVTRKLMLLPSMSEMLPDVVSNLRHALDRESEVDKLDEIKHGVAAMSIAGNSNTPFLTVPFDHTRDSKHNFRSRDQTLLFNNREESRDAFMYQLRAFQEIRGTVLDPSQANMYVSEIKVACQDMINSLLPGNMAWFAGLFSDLLLQIGLVAMEETDKDVLRHVADKERLQKLHRRFTSKGGQKNRSSQKLVLDQNSQTSSSPSASQPEHYFPGHQEFFFIFLGAVDSYKFGVHLRRRLVFLIDGLNSISDVKGLEQRVLKLQLLAKFLGLLVFSPNWNTISPDGASGNSNVALATASNETTDPMIHLRKYVEEGWKEYRLIITVPWVVEFLRMATWDKLSIQSVYFRDIFAILRSIHRCLGHFEENTYNSCGIVMFQLENLFADVVGLSESERLPAVILPRRFIKNTSQAVSGAPVDAALTQLDMLPLRFSKTYLFASSSYLEEFYKLVDEVIENNGKLSCRDGPSKKLRPYAIGVDIGNDARGPSVLTQFDSSQQSAVSSQRMPQAFKQKDNGIQGKLVDAFFHQHRDLQQICEFVVECSVKNVSTILVRDCITPILESPAPVLESPQLDELKSRLDALRVKEQEALTAAREMLRRKCETCIEDAMKALAPPLTKPEVRDMAVTLSVRHASQKGENLIQSIVWQEIQKKANILTNKAKKTAATSEAAAPPKGTKRQTQVANDAEMRVQNQIKTVNHDLKVATSTLHRIAENQTQGDDESAIQTARASLYGISQHECRGPIDRNLDAEGGKFVAALISVLEMWLSGPGANHQCWSNLLSESVAVAVLLGEMGLSDVGLVGSLICEHLRTLIAWCQHSSKGNTENDTDVSNQLADLLVEMLKGELITMYMLERSLISVLDCGEMAEEVARLSVEKVTGGCKMSGDWVNANALKMSRLQMLLARRQRERLKSHTGLSTPHPNPPRDVESDGYNPGRASTGRRD